MLCFKIRVSYWSVLKIRVSNPGFKIRVFLLRKSLLPPHSVSASSSWFISIRQSFVMSTTPPLEGRPSLNLGSLFIDRSLFMETQLGPGESALSCWTLLEIQKTGFMDIQ